MTWQWNIFVVAFWTVFLAELGDKTQLATLTLAAKGHSALSVFAGAALALVAASFIGAFLGYAISQFISPLWIARAAGASFIVLGVLILIGKM